MAELVLEMLAFRDVGYHAVVGNKTPVFIIVRDRRVLHPADRSVFMNDPVLNRLGGCPGKYLLVFFCRRTTVLLVDHSIQQVWIRLVLRSPAAHSLSLCVR